jgi:hypothetical protein
MRFTLSYRDVEDLLGERGVDVSDETVRRWVLKFGPFFARELHRRRHLDEMAVMIASRQFWLWPQSTKATFSTCSCNGRRQSRRIRPMKDIRPRETAKNHPSWSQTFDKSWLPGASPREHKHVEWLAGR